MRDCPNKQLSFNGQDHIATVSLQVEETSAYCTVNHWASASNYQLSNMKRQARYSNRRPQRLEEKTVPLHHRAPLRALTKFKLSLNFKLSSFNINTWAILKFDGKKNKHFRYGGDKIFVEKKENLISRSSSSDSEICNHLLRFQHRPH